ncbi:helix-turn-helix transcriptional regulator [Mycobacterium sp. CBMA271]|uniref:winged helix-turn-helix transcriptional regulator n=1 Tax=unclassified Mycobacteroides TaxID=2618759 RepID=UPI0012DFBF73|nr:MULTISPECIES: helix-turn-helix domain-containing protein [unclassified Mycobacteroides]MUM18893.1 HxlR family transcriptional regulator [Mycobacteroides sp. CBMA 326]MUM23167.1 helix-turn-helix transcriptional regulator [Mycobacteroides sp. CBMA 271]
MRSYGQYCGLARSLEIVGDRWNLLIIRELLIAPARYRDLSDGLPGIATNLLADRLRDLEASGVIERRLTGEGSVVEYVLTPWGAELRQPIESLLRWSTPLMVRGPADDDTFRPEWLALAVPALLNTRVKIRSSVTIGLEIGGPRLQLRATRSGFEVGVHDGRDLDATVRADPVYILGLAAGALPLNDARTLGLVEVDGDEAAARTAFAA